MSDTEFDNDTDLKIEDNLPIPNFDEDDEEDDMDYERPSEDEEMKMILK